MTDIETNVKLEEQIQNVLERNFNAIDEEVLNYLVGVIELNKEDFCTAEDIQEAIGAILGELSNGENDDEFIYELCSKFLDILQCNDPSKKYRSKDDDDDGSIKVLNAPVKISNWLESDKVKEDDEAIKESIFDVTKENRTYVDSKKMVKIDAKLKKKLDQKEGKLEKVAFDYLTYDSTANATASQASNKKSDALKLCETNRVMDITIENFDVAFGNKTLLCQADMTLAFGRRYCLIGRNGIGKTTLLKMISSGSLKIASHINVLHVEQEVHGDDTLALDSVLSCDLKRNKLIAEEKELTDKINVAETKSIMKLQDELSKLYIELEAIESDKAPSRAAKILCGLGFSPEDQAKPTKSFSGGWRMRLALARALFAKPDLLLLDEPTNMLDLKAIIWLENYLQNSWASTLLIVSHDRSFLNQVAQEILYLHSQKIEPFRGNYENFLKTKLENNKSQQREYEAQLEYRQHIQLFIDKFRFNANRAATVQSKIKQLDKLPELVPVEKEKVVSFKFPDVDHLNGTILRLDEVDYYFKKEKYIFKKVDISASMDSRICIVGENGAGKTTLLKVLTGDYEPLGGFRHTHRALRIGYFTQHHVDGLTMNMNCVEVMRSRFPNRNIEEYRAELGKFGVSGDMAMQAICSLSGGQKSRVAFALLSMLNPNFLILDEPTNHLDMETIEALGVAINKFTGGVILVSHDERLITLVCKELWLCRDGQVKSILGGYEEYKKLMEKELEF